MSVDPKFPTALHLVLMSRAPVAGQTKTRLSPPLTPEQARDFHVACLQDILESALAWRDDRLSKGLVTTLHFAITPPGSEAEFHQAGIDWPWDVSVHDQAGETIGDRMEHALQLALENAPEGAAALLVGTDLPFLSSQHFEEAIAALKHADVAFGPTIDGGYYLVGVKTMPQGLLRVRQWSSGNVLLDQIRAVHRKGFQTALISPLTDVDTVEDLRAVHNHASDRRVEGSRALQFIREWFHTSGTPG